MNYQSKVLLIADLPVLQEMLQSAGYNVIADPDMHNASSKLTQEWFHLAIIPLPLADGLVDTARLNLALQSDVLVPKIVLCDQTLDQMSRTVRDALDSLNHPAPSVAFLSQTEGPEAVIDTVGKAIRKYLGINPQLEIYPGREVFYALAGWLKPGSEPGQWAGELEDLFRILFQDCTRITVELRDYLSRRRGEICTVWVRPASETVPEGRPLLVKCGPRENIEKARENYERYFFRITPTRLAGFARTTHFAAAALPAPTETYNLVGDFPSFYRRKRQNEDDIRKAITLFGEKCKYWSQSPQMLPVLQDKHLRALYLDRLNLREQATVGKAIQMLIEQAPSHGLSIEQPGTELGFRFRPREKPDFYPHPLPYLYGNKKGLELMPSRISITHGDLRDENFCVDTNGVIWLDGYESMDWGPAVTDAAGLEAILKFRCSESAWGFPLLYQFERAALFPTYYSDQMPSRDSPPEMQQLLRMIEHLRKEWSGVLSGSDLREYYASLFFFTMRELVTEETSTESRPSEIRKLHALLSAAMICYRLENWKDFAMKGWPGSKEVFPLGGQR